MNFNHGRASAYTRELACKNKTDLRAILDDPPCRRIIRKA